MARANAACFRAPQLSGAQARDDREALAGDEEIMIVLHDCQAGSDTSRAWYRRDDLNEHVLIEPTFVS
eukprot:scaffold44926_cov30-Phaeocystis_antarctica.AAC.1